MKIPRLKTGSIYHVVWEDALARTDWADADYKEMLEDPPLVQLVGFYQGRSKQAILMVFQKDHNDGPVVGERIKIPVGMVHDIKELTFK